VSLDWIVLVVLAVLIAADSLRSGLSRATALALAFPLALAILNYLPDAQFMGGLEQQLPSALLKVAFDAALFVVVFICMYRIVDTFSADSNRPLQALLAGLAAVSIAVVVWLQIPALDSVWHFGPQIQTLFGAAYRFWWLLAAYIALAFAQG
jgi:hypothetical protein